MRTREHIVYGFLCSVFCFIFIPSIGYTEACIIWISSWLLIDLDHVFRYVYYTKNIHLGKFLAWSEAIALEWNILSKKQQKHYQYPVFFFHGLECLLVLLLLTYLSNVFFFVFIGFLFHLFLDWITIIKKRESLLKKMSVIWVLLMNRGKKDFIVEFNKSFKG